MIVYPDPRDVFTATLQDHNDSDIYITNYLRTVIVLIYSSYEAGSPLPTPNWIEII